MPRYVPSVSCTSMRVSAGRSVRAVNASPGLGASGWSAPMTWRPLAGSGIGSIGAVRSIGTVRSPTRMVSCVTARVPSALATNTSCRCPTSTR
ncbi:hypothetical protein K7G98_04035 [Saccharothrix sp. MB29]|nr:hypothetical protein [Saccharothrix sp. MB29]